MSLEQKVDLSDLNYWQNSDTEEWRISLALVTRGEDTISLQGRFLMPRGHEQAVDILYRDVVRSNIPDSPFESVQPYSLSGEHRLAIFCLMPEIQRTVMGRRFIACREAYVGVNHGKVLDPESSYYVQIPILLDELSAEAMEELQTEAIIDSDSCGTSIVSPSGVRYETPQFVNPEWASKIVHMPAGKR